MYITALRKTVTTVLGILAAPVTIPNTAATIRFIRAWQDVNSTLRPENGVGFAIFSGGQQILPNASVGLAADTDGYCPLPTDKILNLDDLEIDVNGPPYDLTVKVYNPNANPVQFALIVGTSAKSVKLPIEKITSADIANPDK